MQSWSSVGRWTLFGTTACVVISILFNTVLFDDLGGESLRRSVISATVLPVLLGLPLFCWMSMRVRGLAISNRKLGLVARTDSLTACLNRGAFTAKVTLLLDQLQPGSSGALLMVDADNFKAINDLFGHDAGDEALTIISRSIRTVLGPGDLVGRMGGEEFGIYLPGADQRGAETTAERVRRSINLAAFTPDGRQRSLSVSIGGAVFDAPASFTELFRVADQRLYGAKRAGRNCTTVGRLADHPVVDLKLTA